MARMSQLLSGASAVYPWDKNAVNSAYRQYLGRDAGDADYEAMRGNPGGLAGVIGTVRDSQEARDYAARPATSTGTSGTTGTTPTTTNPWDASGASQYAPRLVTNSTGTYLTEHGRSRKLANQQEIDDATKYRDDYWRQYGSSNGFQPGVGAQSNAEYQTNWDTDAYATPSYTTSVYGGPLAGYSQQNWDDPNMQTPKYVVGRILSNYNAADAASVAEAIKEVQRAYPGAEFDGKDKLTIPGVGVIDIITNAGGANPAWWWGAQTDDRTTRTASTPTTTGTTSPTGTPTPTTTATGTDLVTVPGNERTTYAADDPTMWDEYSRRWYAENQPY